MERYWITGAFLTCLFGAGVATLLLHAFLRFHSRIVMAYLIAVVGGMLLLIAEVFRIVPAIRFLGDGNLYGYMVLSIIGTGVITFGIPNLAVELTTQDSYLHSRPSILAVSLAAVFFMVYGMYLRFPVVIVISGIIGAAAAWFAGIFVLVRRNQILDQRIRRFACLIAIACIATIPLEILRLYLWNRSTNPFGDSFPPYLLLIFLFLVNGATLILSSRSLIRNAKKVANELDSDAISMFDITPRECEIILYISRGYSNEEIASRLFISTSTVKNHIYHIYQKIGARNRIELLNSIVNSADSA